jgi:hypothetical protein
MFKNFIFTLGIILSMVLAVNFTTFAIVSPESEWLKNDDLGPLISYEMPGFSSPLEVKILRKGTTKFYGYYSTANKVKFHIHKASSVNPYEKECLVTPAANGYWECSVTLQTQEDLYYISLSEVVGPNSTELTSSNVYFQPTVPVLNLDSLKFGYLQIVDPMDSSKLIPDMVSNTVKVNTTMNVSSDFYPTNTGDATLTIDGKKVCEWKKAKLMDIESGIASCIIPYGIYICNKFINVEFQFKAIDGITHTDVLTNYFYDQATDKTLCDYPFSKNSLYRFWSPMNKAHFYTYSLTERNNVIEKYTDNEWTYEGPAYTVPDCSEAGAKKVYRFWSSVNKTHFFTISEAEKVQVETIYPTEIWKYEGVGFCAFTESAADRTPVYRFWSEENKSHFYTANEAEKNDVTAIYTDKQWLPEGTAYYVKK